MALPLREGLIQGGTSGIQIGCDLTTQAYGGKKRFLQGVGIKPAKIVRISFHK
jgi:hypothetical protein